MTDAYDALMRPATPAPADLLGGQRAIPDAQLRQAELPRGQVETPSLIEGYMAATASVSTTAGLMRLDAEAGYGVDPAYVLPPTESKEWKQLTNGIPSEFWDSFARAHSAEHAQYIRERIQTEMYNTQKLAEMGGVGTAILLGRALTDEGAIGLTLLTGGVAAPFVYGAKVNRIRQALKLGTLAAAENAALETVLQKSSETQDPANMLYAVLGGFAMGGTVGALTRGEQMALGKTLRRAGADADLHALNEAGVVSLGKPSRSPLAEAITQSYGEREFKAAGAVDPFVLPEAKRSVGSAEVPPEMGIRPLIDEPAPAEVLNTPKLGAVEERFRYDLAARFASSENPWERYLGGKLVTDPVGARGALNEISAEEVAGYLRRRAETRFAVDGNQALHDWLTANKATVMQRNGMTARFYEAVTEAVRTGNFSDPHIGRAARAWSEAVRDVAAEAKRFGVKGFEDLELRPDYVPRLHSQEKIALMTEKYGTGQVEALVAKSFRRAAHVSEEYAQRLARGYLHKIRRTQAGLESSPQMLLRDKDALGQAMRDAGIEEAQIKETLSAVEFGRDESKAGVTARAKRRLSLDEETTLSMRDRAGNVRDVPITDLFENDARLLLHSYTRSVAGHTALAKTLGVKSRADWEALARRTLAYGHDSTSMSREAIDDGLKKLEFAYKAVTGQPVEDFTTLHKASRLIRDYNFVRVLNQAGFAQLADLGNVVGVGGFRNMVEQIPELGAIIRRVKATGHISDDVAAELEAVIPLGTDMLRHHVPSRFDSGFGEQLEPALTGTVGGRAHEALDAAKRIASTISGLGPLTVIQQRMATKAVAQNFVNTAFGSAGKKISVNRMLSMGVDEEMAGRIFDQIKQHVKTEPGLLTGRKIRKLDFDKWTDLDARDSFALALYRQGRRLVQENDVGSSAAWMHTEVGRLLTQFRSFMLNAYSKQLLHGLKMADFDTFVSWSTGMMFGGLAYVLRQEANTAGLENRQKLLEERLTPERIAAAAFNTAGFSSLVPPAVDSIWQMTGNSPVFAHARTTGLGTSLFDPRGNPTTQTLTLMLNAPGMLKNGVTESEARQMMSLLPFSNALGVKNVLDSLAEDFPKKAPRGD